MRRRDRGGGIEVSNKKLIQYICQTGDIFDAKKVKVLTTIPKGYSRNLFEDFTTGEELQALRDYLIAEKQTCGWRPRITIADWARIRARHPILIEPDGRAVASSVWAESERVIPFGNPHEQSAAENTLEREEHGKCGQCGHELRR